MTPELIAELQDAVHVAYEAAWAAEDALNQAIAARAAREAQPGIADVRRGTESDPSTQEGHRP